MKRLLAFSQQVFAQDRATLRRLAGLAERPEGRYLLEALPMSANPAFFMGGALPMSGVDTHELEQYFSQTLTITAPFAKELGLPSHTSQVPAAHLFATPVDAALWDEALNRLIAGEREITLTLRLYISGEVVWSIVRLASLIPLLKGEEKASLPVDDTPSILPEALADFNQPINEAHEVDADGGLVQYPPEMLPAYIGSIERLDVPQIAQSLVGQVPLRAEEHAAILNDLKRLTERTTLMITLSGPVVTRYGTLADLLKQHLPATDCPIVAPTTYFGAVLVGRALKTAPDKVRDILAETLSQVRSRYGIDLHPDISILSIPIAESPASLRLAVRTYLEALAAAERPLPGSNSAGNSAGNNAGNTAGGNPSSTTGSGSSGSAAASQPPVTSHGKPRPNTSLTLADVVRLTDAIQNDFSGFQLLTQLQVAAKTGRFSGAECLVRFIDEIPNMGPGRFVPLLESGPLAIAFGRKIFEMAISLVAIFRQAIAERAAQEPPHTNNKPFRLGVNVSPAQTADLFWGEFVSQTLQKNGVPGTYFEFELTETSRAIPMRNLSAWMDECRALGITWALDDFGMGYNGIDMMLKGSFETVKFDRAFVLEALANPQTETFFKYLIQACRAQGATICLEGIEDAQVLERVHVFMADAWQGFYFARPEAPREAAARLFEHHATGNHATASEADVKPELLEMTSGNTLDELAKVAAEVDALDATDNAPTPLLTKRAYRTISFRPFLFTLFAPLIILLLFMAGLFLTFNADVEKEASRLTKEAVSRIIAAQASAVRVEQLRTSLTTLSETNDSTQAAAAYDAAKALLTSSTFDRHGETRDGMKSLLNTVETVWQQRQAFDAKANEVDTLWQTLYFRMMTISALSAGANPEQLPLIEGAAKELSLQAGQIEAMHTVVSRAMDGYGYICSRSAISSRLAFTEDLIIQCRQLRRTESDLHKTIDELATARRIFAEQIRSMDKDAVALEQQFTNIETRDLVSDIDVVHSLTVRYRPWTMVLMGAIGLLILISAIGMIVVLRPIDKLLKALRAYRRQGIKPAATMHSRIREFNDMISWLRLFVELTDREQAKRTAIASKYSELLSEAHRDSLTGVANRRALQEALSRAVPLLADTAVLMIDIDHFKVLNDTKGHLFGDRILAAVGDVLRRNVSHKDSVYRYGGEEFCLVLTGVTQEQAQGVALRLLEKVRAISRGTAENFAPNAAPDPLTISVGVSSVLATIGEKPLDKLIAEADTALYEAKAQGRNQVVVHQAKEHHDRRH